MGRGRQKAKDAKIARELKYTNHGGDLRDLERELVSGSAVKAAPKVTEQPEEYLDRWATDDDE